ncbi:MAG: ATP-binding cassette domain-containing protein [Alphaproteobacteria bacterium]|nr:ATP-binding cassette domain-containing protein [Alphaproteobacteria bacterium]
MSARAFLGAGALFAAAAALCFAADGYQLFVIATVGLTAIVGLGLNVLLGLAGQVSLGHVGFYAIGAYTVAILQTKLGVSFWLALPVAAALSAVVGTILAIPPLRVRGPYLAMITIAFGFIVEHGAVEWRALTGGANGILGIPDPSLFGLRLDDRPLAILIVGVTAAATLLYWLFARSAWGAAMRAARDAETASESLGLNLVAIRTAAFTLSAAAAGIAGAFSVPLTNFVAPSAFPFFQSILFLLAVIIGGAGTVMGPLIGAVVVVLLPEYLAFLAEYRLLFFGGLLLVVLWIAPEGIVGAVARHIARPRERTARPERDIEAFLRERAAGGNLEIDRLSVAFGGVRAANDISFAARPGQVTSIIGPNGAGKTTVLNLLCGFYRPDAGSIALAGIDLTGKPSHEIARAGVSRTYQTTQLFGQMSVLDNLLVALRRGRLGSLTAPLCTGGDDGTAARTAESLLSFVGYRGSIDRMAGGLPHVDKRLVEIARALATGPRVLVLDEPAAGLGAADKTTLAALLRRIADTGVAVVLVEHDMTLVMGISDHVVVLDAGAKIAAGTPAEVRADPAVRKAYLGEEMALAAAPRAAAGPGATLLETAGLIAGYGAEPVLKGIGLTVAAGEMVAVLGANGAGKSTLMKALSGLRRPVQGTIALHGRDIAALPAHRIVAQGLILVPEGRQVFPELSVLDNIRLGAFTRRDGDIERDVEAALQRFPQLRERLHNRAGLLSGGEQQMLAIARGLMTRPQLLLLDEPSLGLAPQLVRDLFQVLARLRNEGTTILLVDQMAGLALALADRGYVIESGRIVHHGTPDEIRSNKALEQAYLGSAA